MKKGERKRDGEKEVDEERRNKRGMWCDRMWQENIHKI